MKTIDRIKQLADNESITITNLESKIGASKGVLSRALKNSTDIQGKWITLIVENYPLYDANWLLTGDGEMLKSENMKPSKSQSKGVPYYNVDFIGGFDLVMSDQTLRPDYLIDFQKYNDADCWCNVTGHSMEPEINNGDIIALKEVKEWQTFLPFGEVYGIVTNEHRTIKRVTASTKEGFLKLVPTNKSSEYQPQDIPVSIIIRIFRVLGCVKKF